MKNVQIVLVNIIYHFGKREIKTAYLGNNLVNIHTIHHTLIEQESKHS